MPGKKILLVDDDKSLLRVTEKQLTDAGYRVTKAESAETALTEFESGGFDLVVTDVQMPGMDGLELLAELKRRDSTVAVVVVTAFGSVERAVQAMCTGAVDFLEKPYKREALLLAAEKGLRFRALLTENVRLQMELTDRFSFEEIIGGSAAMRDVFSILGRVAASDVSVLIRGESGTGKELIARAIHYRGARAKKPFVAVNCAAIPENLIESDLFGHMRGAFTGAVADRPGRFLEAYGGTLFLDEIGELRPEVQAKLLRVLQDGEVRPLGGTESFSVDVRLVTATNRDLEAALEEGIFRQDLYYRVAVVVLALPPLRDRADDIPLLARHFLVKKGSAGLRMEPGFLAGLQAYAWPGNVRELENAIDRALVLRQHEDRLISADLPPWSTTDSGVDDPFAIEIPDEGLSLAAVEKGLIGKALEKTAGNRSRAARLLGITRQTLLYRMEKHGRK